MGRGKLANSNAEQVRKMRTILTELEPSDCNACPRQMLALKGGDMVGFGVGSRRTFHESTGLVSWPGGFRHGKRSASRELIDREVDLRSEPSGSLIFRYFR
jgi:hypothetical protein